MRTVAACLLVLVLLAAPRAWADSAATEREWTLLIFMNGDNNLSDYGPDDLNKMEVVGSTDQVAVVGMYDSEGDHGTKIYCAQKDDDVATVTSPVVLDMPEQDMGDWRTMVEFVRFGVERYPAKRYLLSIWDHGSGWNKAGRLRSGASRGISYDDESGNHITTVQLGEAMGQIAGLIGHKLDVLAMDACLMQMVEVGAEVRGSAEVLWASEETAPGYGWPFAELLGALVAAPTMTTREFSRIHVERWVAAYQGGPGGTEDVTQSAVDLATYDELLARLDALSTALMLRPELRQHLSAAAGHAQSYDTPSYKDLVDVLDLLTPKLDGALREQAVALAEFVRTQVVVANGVNGEAMARSNGLSIWIPGAGEFSWSKARYAELSFARATAWDELLAWLTGRAAARRP